MSPPKPTILLVTGAWHLPSFMNPFAQELEKLGYETSTVGLPTAANQPQLSLEDDVAALKSHLHDLIEEQGKDIVLYLHSLAGCSGSSAIEGLAKADRSSAGKPGGIVALIYQSAFIPKEGLSVQDMVGGNYPPWQHVDEETGLITALTPQKIFYTDIPEPLATQAAHQVQKQSIRSFNSPNPPVFYADPAYDRRRFYIHTGQDHTIPPFVQDKFLEESGVRWEVTRLEDAAHSPCLSRPRELAGIVGGEMIGAVLSG